MRIFLTLFLAFGAVLAVASALTSQPPTSARLVRASVRMDGVELLWGSTSDNGKPDADRVWSYLKGLRFEPTDAFLEMLPEEDAEEVTLSSADEDGNPVQRRIEVEVAYGGWAFPHKLRLVKSEPNQRGQVWAVDPAIIESHADLRYLSRYEAGRLKKR